MTAHPVRSRRERRPRSTWTQSTSTSPSVPLSMLMEEAQTWPTKVPHTPSRHSVNTRSSREQLVRLDTLTPVPHLRNSFRAMVARVVPAGLGSMSIPDRASVKSQSSTVRSYLPLPRR